MAQSVLADLSDALVLPRARIVYEPLVQELERPPCVFAKDRPRFFGMLRDDRRLGETSYW